MRRLMFLPVLACLVAACGGGGTPTDEASVGKSLGQSVPRASEASSANTAATPLPRGCDAVELQIWLGELGIPGSVGPLEDGRARIYLSENPRLDEQVELVREKCGDRVVLETGPPIELVN